MGNEEGIRGDAVSQGSKDNLCDSVAVSNKGVLMMENTIDVLTSSDLVTKDDVEFIHEHAKQFDKRFKTRSLFRSKTEMVASVLSDYEHPTTDSKYWQAIGEQNVHLSELISLTYSQEKLKAEIQILEVQDKKLEVVAKRIAEELEDGEAILRDSYMEEQRLEIALIAAKRNKLAVQIAEKKYQHTGMMKMAQERMREIKTWEELIADLEATGLEYGTENFELHHAKRYLLRYANRVADINNLSPEARENALMHFKSFLALPENNALVQQLGMSEVLANMQSPSLQGGGYTRAVTAPDKNVTYFKPKKTMQKDYATKEEMAEKDEIAASYLNHNVKVILVGAPHRAEGQTSVTDFFAMQLPAAFSGDISEPFGLPVPDARNEIVKKALETNAEYIFFVDDDVLLPRNGLVKLMHTLQKNKAKIVTGFYYRKYFPLESCGMHIDENGQPIRIEFDNFNTLIHNTLVPPMGCTLIHTSIFREMQEKLGVVDDWYGSITLNGRPAITEDTYFSERVRKLGYDIITDLSVQCVHIDREVGILYGHPDIIYVEERPDVPVTMFKSAYRNYFCMPQ